MNDFIWAVKFLFLFFAGFLLGSLVAQVALRVVFGGG